MAGRWVNVASAIQAIKSVYGRFAPFNSNHPLRERLAVVVRDRGHHGHRHQQRVHIGEELRHQRAQLLAFLVGEHPVPVALGGEARGARQRTVVVVGKGVRECDQVVE